MYRKCLYLKDCESVRSSVVSWVGPPDHSLLSGGRKVKRYGTASKENWLINVFNCVVRLEFINDLSIKKYQGEK